MSIIRTFMFALVLASCMPSSLSASYSDSVQKSFFRIGGLTNVSKPCMPSVCFVVSSSQHPPPYRWRCSVCFYPWSCWADLLPEKFIRPLLTFIKTKGGKKFVLILAFVLSLVFVGVIPTLNFIWSNIFRIWRILLVIPLAYWTLAIISVYSKVLVQGGLEFSRDVLKELKWKRFLLDALTAGLLSPIASNAEKCLVGPIHVRVGFG